MQDSIFSHKTSQMPSSSHNSRPQIDGQCPICHLKPTIVHNLHILKQAVIQKNKTICELQQFIQKISQMALPRHSMVPPMFNNKEMTFSQPVASSSSINTDHSAQQKLRIKNSISRQVKKISIGSQSTSNITKQSALRLKLMDIINVLPKNPSSGQFSMQTQSQPLKQGSVYEINSRVLNNSKLTFGKEIYRDQGSFQKSDFESRTAWSQK